MDKTFGKLIDEYIATELTSHQSISSVYLYMGNYQQQPKAVICTAEQDYDYTDVLYKIVDLREQETEAKAQVKALQDKIRQLEKSKRDVEKAIKLLKGDL